jgi:hypothetical protein
MTVEGAFEQSIFGIRFKQPCEYQNLVFFAGRRLYPDFVYIGAFAEIFLDPMGI